MSIIDYDHTMEPYTVGFDEDKLQFHFLHVEDAIVEPTCAACMEPDEEPETEFDPGPEVDDEGGMSEHRFDAWSIDRDDLDRA